MRLSTKRLIEAIPRWLADGDTITARRGSNGWSVELWGRGRGRQTPTLSITWRAEGRHQHRKITADWFGCAQCGRARFSIHPVLGPVKECRCTDALNATLGQEIAAALKGGT
jgi:hypothetical protein